MKTNIIRNCSIVEKRHIFRDETPVISLSGAKKKTKNRRLRNNNNNICNNNDRRALTFYAVGRSLMHVRACTSRARFQRNKNYIIRARAALNGREQNKIGRNTLSVSAIWVVKGRIFGRFRVVFQQASDQPRPR